MTVGPRCSGAVIEKGVVGSFGESELRKELAGWADGGVVKRVSSEII